MGSTISADLVYQEYLNQKKIKAKETIENCINVLETAGSEEHKTFKAFFNKKSGEAIGTVSNKSLNNS